MIRVLLADDEGMIRSALAALLRLEPDIDVVAECADGEQAVAEALRLRPDVCLLDLRCRASTACRWPRRVNRAIATRLRGPSPVMRVRGCCAVPWLPGVAGFLRSLAERTRSQRSSAASRPEPATSILEIAADALSDERSPLTDRELDVLRAGPSWRDDRADRAGTLARSRDRPQPHLRHPREAFGRHTSAGRAHRRGTRLDLTADRLTDMGTICAAPMMGRTFVARDRRA